MSERNKEDLKNAYRSHSPTDSREGESKMRINYAMHYKNNSSMNLNSINDPDSEGDRKINKQKINLKQFMKL